MEHEPFNHQEVEQKWQAYWKEHGTFKTVEDPQKPKQFVLDMFPYPSGEGLHVGHPKGYIATDIYSRTKRMQGHSVLHPMGWDAFGLPAENFAIKNKTHPRQAVEKNIANFKQQLAHIGFDYDWDREINTTDPAFYKWTQWIFLKMLEQGLAYQSDEPINWCPSCMTGLANEDLDGNVCERCDTPVIKKKLPQWILKITDYADRMLTDLDTLDWPEHIKEAQRNWIGRSEGAEIPFPLRFSKPEHNEHRDAEGNPARLTVFTTRPDTIFGATYLVLAPEHPWVTLALDTAHQGVLENADEVRAYVAAASAKNEIERTAEGREKTGVVLRGVVAINPATNAEIPVYIADYVLADYGTGAIMAVPAHDERDLAFAQKYNLPIRQVIAPHFIDAANPPQEGKPVVARDTILAIVHNPKDDTYLALKWKEQPWTTFVTGGIDEGERPLEAALREVQEETGYTDLALAQELGQTVCAFFAAHKNENRIAHGSAFLFELKSDARVEISPEERTKHEPVWLSLDEITAEKMRHAEIAHLVERMRNPAVAYTGEGTLVNSGSFSGKTNTEVATDIVAAVGGKMTTRYKLRDWVFSRQRYWGEPIPVIHCPTDGVVPVPYEDLPVTLPEVTHYEPTGTGESPLAAIDSWVNTTCPKCGGPAKRETNTMPQWAGSSWYYLRFMDPHDDTQMVSEKREKYWAPVDVYVGGDHAVRHLIYARFWHKFLYDIGVVSTNEPFARLEFLGFILAEDGRKMSKRLGNVINPNDVVHEYGADAFRIYEMFMGPFENTTAWSTASIAGTARYIERVWRTQTLVQDAPVPELDSVLAQTIKKVGEDIEAFKFNTAVSQLMILQNAVEKAGAISKEAWRAYIRLLAPLAPHITEELWARLGETESVHRAAWPEFDPEKLISDSATIVVQVNGKRRGELHLARGTEQETVASQARELAAVAQALDTGAPKRVVFVPDKLINFVV